MGATQTHLARLARFGTVGVINTLFSYSIILIGLSFGWGDVLANATGFAAGLFTSFILNRNWTFKSDKQFRQGTAFRYLVLFAICYVSNLAVVLVTAPLGLAAPLRHLAGMLIYSVMFYVGSVRYVFVGREYVD